MQKSPDLKVGAAMKRMEKLLLDSKKLLCILSVDDVLIKTNRKYMPILFKMQVKPTHFHPVYAIMIFFCYFC